MRLAARMQLPKAIVDAGDRLRRGEPVLLYDRDDREAETDLFFAAEHATPAAVRELRREAGGLVFVAVHPRPAQVLGLPFLQDVFAQGAATWPVLETARVNDLKYDARSSFSLPINHRRTFTGITDDDRSLTIRRFAEMSREALDGKIRDGPAAFGAEFRAPGHVHLCVGAPRLLLDRDGHTELAVALAELVGVTPVLVGAEMLGEGRALPYADAAAYAARRNTVHLDGELVREAWQTFKAHPPLAV